MALPAREQAKYWSIAAVSLFAVLWALGDVVLPFVLGAAIAYLLDPLADRLQRLGLPTSPQPSSSRWRACSSSSF
jgi:predicted PurR-regulated permease PerM